MQNLNKTYILISKPVFDEKPTEYVKIYNGYNEKPEKLHVFKKRTILEMHSTIIKWVLKLIEIAAIYHSIFRLFIQSYICIGIINKIKMNLNSNELISNRNQIKIKYKVVLFKHIIHDYPGS